MSQNYLNEQPIGQNQYGRPQYQQYQQNFQPPRPNGPKPQPKPIPMDIDHSQQTRAVNYMNWPNNNAFGGKRPIPPSNQVHQPFKQHRINHIEPADNTLRDTQQQINEEHTRQSWEVYYNQYPSQDNMTDREPIKFSDIHFLG